MPTWLLARVGALRLGREAQRSSRVTGERSELRGHRLQIGKSAALAVFVAGLIHLELLTDFFNNIGQKRQTDIERPLLGFSFVPKSRQPDH